MENNTNENVVGKNVWIEVFEWVQAIVVALVIAMFLRTYVFTIVNVSGTSMVPTLQHQDKLFVWRLGYEPKVGDVIIFRPQHKPESPYVKRVIATAGQTVEIRVNESSVKKIDGVRMVDNNTYADVYVDGVKLEEGYINEKIAYHRLGDLYSNGAYPCVVPEGHIFVMGDNRNNSTDSRDLGMVPVDSVIGKATTRIWPLNQIGGLDK